MAEAIRWPQRLRGLARAVAIVAAATLAGCQTLVPKGPPPPVTRPEPTRRPPVERPRPVQPGIPVDNERDRVALLVPLTGPNAGVGRSLANATQMALLDADATRIRITSYDTNLGAAAAAQRALADGNGLILGPLLSENVRAVAPLAAAAHVPVVSFSNDTSVAGDGVYLLGYAPTQSIDRIVGYARSRGMKTFAGLVPNGLYGERASTAFLRAVENAGGQVASLQTFDRGTLPASVARLAKNAPFDAVLVADNGANAALAVPVLRKDGVTNAQILGTELWNAEASTAAKPGLSGAWFASVPDTLYRQYAAKYRARFGSAPYRLSSLGYDAVLLTVRIARDWRPGSEFPERDLRDSGGFSGIDGAFRFGRDGVAERALEVQAIQNGTTVTLSPAPTSFDR